MVVRVKWQTRKSLRRNCLLKILSSVNLWRKITKTNDILNLTLPPDCFKQLIGGAFNQHFECNIILCKYQIFDDSKYVINRLIR